ncbi:hypothetical protein C8R44DRAFT_758168 [Mycena epipterygia]|nr:hypothetical protein C8R44DRAFT_758168 [Mycena epipterygia]
MQRTGILSFSSIFCLRSAAKVLIHPSRLHFLLFTIPFISWLPTRCWALELGAPEPEDTQSITVFTGGTLSLAWTLNASDPQLFDLVLVGVSGNKTVFPDIDSIESPWKLVIKNSPQNYFFQALDHTTGATLAESSTFQVTAAPTILSGSMFPLSGDNGAPNIAGPGPTSTNAIPSTQSQVTQHSTAVSRRALIGIIVGAILCNTVLIALATFIWRYRVRRRRGNTAHPVLIDEDVLPKDESEESSPPLYTHLFPFPMPGTPPPRLAPLRASRLRPASEYKSPSPHHSSSHRPPFSHRKLSSYDTTSPSSTHRPASSYQPGSKRAQMSHHRKLSHNLPPSSPLSYASPISPKDRRPTPRGSLTPATARRLELQVELETALSETVYDKDEPETPSKIPTRRRVLRSTSEPRPLSSEFGSAEGHDEMIRHGPKGELASEQLGDIP